LNFRNLDSYPIYLLCGQRRWAGRRVSLKP
jgi:hypothetical protein